jgi:predicted homoserine dehydrogenase-like protein
MIIVDTALRERQRQGKPIRVGLVGAGFAGKGFALQLLSGLPGLRLAAISNRTLSEAETAYRGAGVNSFTHVTSVDQLEGAIAKNQYALTDDASLLCTAPSIDCIVEATGEIDFAAHVCMKAFAHKKHVIVLNAELDATLGPILKVHADKAGVIYAQADGDQPAVLMNLYRYVESLGFKPVMAGNIKSLQDCRRTPKTQLDFATRHWQRPKFITSFADGTKISQEMATVANATGFRVQTRGMAGPRCDHVDNAWKLFDMDKLMNGGLVDYILGAQPSFGVFILAHSDNPLKQRYMKVYKMGDGPIYTFYTPFHLSPIEAPNSVARAVLFGDAPLKPLAGPVCDVITIAKRDLRAGEVLDGIGGFLSYGTIDNSDTAAEQNLLPMGLSEGCVLKRDLPMDAAVSYDDVELPKNRLSDKLRTEQNKLFKLAPRPMLV